MTQYHSDDRVNRAFIELLDRLTEHERHTGQESTVVFVPHNPEEPVVMAQNGKPVSEQPFMGAREILDIAIRERGE